MKSSIEYSRRISDSLSQIDPGLSVAGVKAAVSAELRELDPTMKLESTQYFNHSFSPDFVASWPKDPSIGKRYIYLKISSQLNHLIEDVELISDQRPIVFGLGPTPSGSDELASAIQQTTHRTNTLLTDANGLGELIERKDVPFVNLASNAVAQGGRGVIDKENGADTAHRLESGFEGALAVDSGRTAVATMTLGELLGAKYADRMTHLLEAVWVGAGGDLEEFPGHALGFRNGIADEALQFLLEYREIANRRFWQRLGHGVSIAQLGRMKLPEGSSNLEHFVAANIHDLSARACRVIDNQQLELNSPERPPQTFHWFVEGDRRLLALQGSTFTALFGTNVSDLGQVKRERNSGIRVSDLLKRARYSNITEADLALTEGAKRTIKYISEDRSNLQKDLQEGRILPEYQMNDSATLVKRAGVELTEPPERRILSCDFQTGTAYRRTSSRISLAELAGEGIPILHDLVKSDYIALLDRTASGQGSNAYYIRQLLDSDYS